MTYLDHLYHRATARKAETPAPARLRVSGEAVRWEPPDATQTERQARLYAQLAWIQIAVANVAAVFAATPFRVSQRTGEGERGITAHPFEELLRRPNPAQSRFEFLEATYAWRRITGNAYWWLNRASPEAPPDELWIIPSGQIVPVPDGAGHVRGYMYDPGDGRPIPLETHEVAHFKTFNPLSRYVGLSAVQALALDGTADLAAQRYNAAFYDRDNAKMDGILAFSDAVEDGAWNRLKEEMKDQTGGTKRKRMLMLRGAGAGGVQWIATQMSRAEMGYLEQRTFTKEEIFGLLAPGLASVLAVNATEANSTAGKDTFLSFAVYPAHVAISEKIAADVLTAYGDGLVGAFDDVRRADTEMELRAREAYERTHTVDETRARYDGDAPLGDERGQMLVGAAQSRPAPALVEPAEPTPDALAAAGKALDRRRWRDKALKAVAAGRGAEVPFTPEYLDDDEAMAIRAALKRGDVGAAFKGEG